MKTASPAQIAARAKFAEMSRGKAAARKSGGGSSSLPAAASSGGGKKSHKVAWIVAGVIGAFGATALGFYLYGKSQTTQAQLPPDDTSGDPTPESVLLVLAEKIYNDIKGINFFTEHDNEAYQAVLAMGNYDFTRLYNIFNARYQHSWYNILGVGKSQTLTEALRGEAVGGFAGSWGAIKEAMLNRLASLNLK